MASALLRILGMTVGDRGFSLIEALVAMTIMLVGVLPLAQLMAASTRSNASARANSLATWLAVAKAESLRAIEWGNAGLAPSPAGALSTNTPGYVEYLDGRGTTLSDTGLVAGTPPVGTVYVRRWSVVALPATLSAVVLQVVVKPWPDRGAADAVRVAAVRTREQGQ
jgi:prepilin-type N-terminal cleavage/methylation domain-containing protein